MTSRLYLKKPIVVGGATVELTGLADFADEARGAPFFDQHQPLVELGMRYYQGEACQGQFTYVSDTRDLLDEPFASAFPLGHALVTWTEDAPGAEVWLARNRVANSEGGRGDIKVDKNTEWKITTEDCNVELRGQAFTESWIRPEETDIERLVALQLYTLNGSSSTATNHRDTCLVIVNTSHLAPNTATVTMPAKKYLPGTQPQEVVQDCAQMAGKDYGVVIHHTGGSHLCLLYVETTDHTTYAAAPKISDDIADWDPTDPTTPIFEPHWERGWATNFGMQTVNSGLVGIYNIEQPVYVNSVPSEEQYEYWVDSWSDGSSTTAAQMADRVAAMLTERSQIHVTHRVSIIMAADQVDMLTAGMSIQVKTTATADPTNTYITRRIAELRWELRPSAGNEPRQYWAHMDLARPVIRVRPGTGVSGPLPPVQSEPPTAAVTDVLWTFDAGTVYDVTATYPSVPHAHPGYLHAHVLNPATGNTSSAPKPPVTAGNTYHVRARAGRNAGSPYNTGGLYLSVRSYPSGTLIGGPWGPIDPGATGSGVGEEVGGDVVIAGGDTTIGWEFPHNSHFVDEVQVSHGGVEPGFVGTPTPGAATGPEGTLGTSPIYSPIDHTHAAQTAAVTLLSDDRNVDQAFQELSWKQPVRVATTAAGTLATSFENGDTVDGVVLATGDRILIKNQAAGAENGIYTVNASGAPTRTIGFDLGVEAVGAAVFVSEGTANADKMFICTTNAPITIDSTTLTFAEFGAGVTDHGALTGLADDDHPQYLQNSELADAGHYEVVVDGTAPPVAVTNEAEDDWVYGWVSG